MAADGEHLATIVSHNKNIVQVSLRMADVKKVEFAGDDFIVNSGTPHYITFVNNVEKIDVVLAGRTIRYNPRFSEPGTNVDFVEIHDKNMVVRTYEKGVENETLSCGTGVTASAIAAWYKNKHTNYGIQTKGGALNVTFNQTEGIFTDIWLEGPTEMVFKGEIEI